MNAAELDALLRQFLIDGQFSRAERTALVSWAQKNADTETKRAAARSRVFEVVRSALNHTNSTAMVTFLEGVLKVFQPLSVTATSTGSSRVCFSPGDACLSLIVNSFDRATKSVDICVFTITDDRICRAILAAQRRGLALRIVTDNEKAFDAGSDVPKFREAKIPIKVDMTLCHMHHKFAIFDGRRLLNGSYNWTRGAAEQNAENIVDTDTPALVSAFQKEFDAIWNKLD